MSNCLPAFSEAKAPDHLEPTNRTNRASPPVHYSLGGFKNNHEPEQLIKLGNTYI